MFEINDLAIIFTPLNRLNSHTYLITHYILKELYKRSKIISTLGYLKLDESLSAWFFDRAVLNTPLKLTMCSLMGRLEYNIIDTYIYMWLDHLCNREHLMPLPFLGSLLEFILLVLLFFCITFCSSFLQVLYVMCFIRFTTLSK